MAKKKKPVAKKAKKSKKGRSPKQASPKKSPAKKSPAKKLAVAKKSTTASSGGRGTSVDSLLKKYEKERKTQESKLSASLKKIKDLELKAQKLEEQIAKLKDDSKTTQAEIDQLDSRRDADIAEVLSKLGVQLSAGSAGGSSAGSAASSSAGSSSAQADPKPVLTLGTKLPPKIDDDEDD
jgi:chromosome segregation ATPase